MELFCTFIKMSLRWLPTRFDTDLTDMKPTARYAVFGHPIAHSRSPEIHLAFSKQEGADIVYEKMLLPLDGFATGVREQLKLGLQGANVTVPFKLDACAFADELSERADKAGAANTLIVRADGSVLGDNSDGLGLMQDITVNQGMTLRGKKVLLLGAGGAVRLDVRRRADQARSAAPLALNTCPGDSGKRRLSSRVPTPAPGSH